MGNTQSTIEENIGKAFPDKTGAYWEHQNVDAREAQRKRSIQTVYGILSSRKSLTLTKYHKFQLLYTQRTNPARVTAVLIVKLHGAIVAKIEPGANYVAQIQPGADYEAKVQSTTIANFEASAFRFFLRYISWELHNVLSSVPDLIASPDGARETSKADKDAKLLNTNGDDKAPSANQNGLPSAQVSTPAMTADLNDDSSQTHKLPAYEDTRNQ